VDAAQVLEASALALVGAPAFVLLPFSSRLRVSLWLTALSSGLVAIAAVTVLVRDSSIAFALWAPAPYAQLAFRLDPLGAVFAAIIAGAALFPAVFGTAYAVPRRIDDAAFPLFVLSMVLVAGAATLVIGLEVYFLNHAIAPSASPGYEPSN